MKTLNEVPTTAKDNLQGILWTVAAGLCFVVMTGLVRWLGTDLPVTVAGFLRYVCGVVILLPVLVKLVHYRPGGKILAIFTLRGLTHGIGVMLWFYAMTRIPVAEVTAIGYTTPIFITIGAVLIFGEKMYLRRIAAVIAGLFGVLIVLRPGFHDIGAGQWAQLTTAPFFACSYLITKYLTRSEKPVVIVGMLTITCTLVLLPGAVINWQTPSMGDMACLFFTAIFATAGHYCLTKSWQAAPMTVTQPITFLQLVWATLLGLLVFNEPVDPYVLAGGAVIVAAVSYIAHREAVTRRKSRS